ncbi:hypothetical protein [Streptomyces sp. NPDC006510]|uniref:hypothetical protein n=1 Tax=Streptomyces sp. NPDC006510 TaxID=3155600 RepID=UPI0033BFA7CB
MVRIIEVLLDLGSLPAFLQVKGGSPSYNESHVRAAFPRFFRTHADHLPTFLTQRQAIAGLHPLSWPHRNDCTSLRSPAERCLRPAAPGNFAWQEGSSYALPEIDDICLVTTGDAFHWIAPAPGIAVHPSANARSWARIARQT